MQWRIILTRWQWLESSGNQFLIFLFWVHILSPFYLEIVDCVTAFDVYLFSVLFLPECYSLLYAAYFIWFDFASLLYFDFLVGRTLANVNGTSTAKATNANQI